MTEMISWKVRKSPGRELAWLKKKKAAITHAARKAWQACSGEAHIPHWGTLVQFLALTDDSSFWPWEEAMIAQVTGDVHSCKTAGLTCWFLALILPTVGIWGVNHQMGAFCLNKVKQIQGDSLSVHLGFISKNSLGKKKVFLSSRKTKIPQVTEKSR